MPNLTVNYYAYGRRGRRHSASPVVPIAPSLHSSPISGTPADINAYPISGYPTFAFWSIVGESGGGRVSRTALEVVHAADDPLIATAWYLPSGGGGTGGPGLGIDAFDVNRGQFFDDDFVSVAPDAALSAAANYDGFVPTASIEHITAFDPCHEAVISANIPFVNWMVVDPPAPATGTVLNPPVGSNGTAFAMYRLPDGIDPGFKRPHIDELLTWLYLSPGVLVGGGGFGIRPGGGGPVPIDPVGALIARLDPAARQAVTGVLLNGAAKQMAPNEFAAQLGRIGIGMAEAGLKALNADIQRTTK